MATRMNKTGETCRRTRSGNEKRADAGALASARFFEKEGIGRGGGNKIERETGGGNVPRDLRGELKKARAENGLQNILKRGACQLTEK